jgi:hypothetical protein
MAGISRFVPCSWASVIPPGGIVTLRDEKERVLQRVWQHRMPWTLIDVGYWQQLSIPRVPSGRLDYVIVLPANEIHAGGEAKNLLMNKCDIGAFVARIVKDPKTVNKKVICWAEELSQKDVVKMVEEKSGEKLEMTEVSFFSYSSIFSLQRLFFLLTLPLPDVRRNFDRPPRRCPRRLPG